MDMREVGTTLWISRKLHDAVLAKDVVFWQDNLSQKDARWNLFGKGILCESKKDVGQLRHKITQFMSSCV